MDELLLHPSTLKDLRQIVSSKHHAVGLVGPYGAGKGHTAHVLAKQWLEPSGGINRGLYVLMPVDSVISIEMVRELRNFLKLKSPGTDAVRRVVIIEDAQNMTIEAQNALLKLLEEPPSDVRFVLTISSRRAIRPTIYSRLQPVIIKPCDLQATLDYFSSIGHGQHEINRAFQISRGYGGLCAAILDDDSHALSKSIDDAKQLIRSTAHERLLRVEEYSKDKEQLKQLLFALKRVIGAAITHTEARNTKLRLIRQLRAVYFAEANLLKNANTKLLLTDLFLTL